MILATLLMAALSQDSVVKGEQGAAIDAAVQRKTGGGFWGAVLVAKGGEVLLSKGYGFADYGSTPNTPRTLFELASVSKQITAAAVLKLEMEGKLAISDSIDQHFKNVPEEKKAITIHQLLTHTSGISAEIGLPYAATETRDQLLAFVMKSELVTDPGKKFAYCNVAYALLAALVEVASGKSFEEYVKEKLFKPAGMTDSGFIKDSSLDAKRAASRLAKGESSSSSVDWFYGWGYRGMGGVVSTTPDLLKWDRALRGEKILDAKTKAKLYAPAKDRYACGWFVEKTKHGTKAHHSGGVAGFATWFTRYLDEDVVIIVLSNGSSNVYEVSRAIEEAVFGGPGIEASIDLGPFELGEWASLDFNKKASWKVSAVGGAVQLVLEAEKHAVVTIKLPKEAAKALADELNELVEAKGGAEGKVDMDSGIYLGGYVIKEKKLKVSGVEPKLMAKYVGVDGDGKEVVDDRITFILDDAKRHQWPVMVKMSPAAAAALAKELGK